MPVVSHKVMPRTFSAAKRSIHASTAAGSTSPSIGQPNTQDSDTLTGTAGLARQRDHLRQLREGLLARHAQVGEVVALAGRHDEVELVDVAVERALGAAQVGHQRGVDHAGAAHDAHHHFLAVAQRRNGLAAR